MARLLAKDVMQQIIPSELLGEGDDLTHAEGGEPHEIGQNPTASATANYAEDGH
jgi:hypothetical protein